ncbi:MAG TPA: hypothetical protein VN817_00795 [Solirubrobacteraceae bacterium]|nr:hypothetical protein [Solirubrobacteraceae bacterium]
MNPLKASLTYANVMATVAVFLALGGGAYAATQLPKNSVGTKQLKTGAVTPNKLSAAAKRVLSGSTGTAGATGDAGPKGIQGVAGAVGPSGIQGLQGLQGDSGKQGAPGEAGEAGKQGDPGEGGEQGEKGEQGERGEQGEPGISNGYFFTSGPAFDEWDGGEQLLASLELPAGNFIVDSHVLGNNNAGETANVSCLVKLGGVIIGETGEASLGANNSGEDRTVISLSLGGTQATPGMAELICRAQAGFPGNWLERGMTAIQVSHLTG